MRQSACFISLEGLDGAGKSTHIPWMETRLRAAGIRLLSTREPGGTPLGESLRDLLLHHDMQARTEALLMFAARNELWQTRIQPALAQGQWVLCDRHIDASYAYQGGGRALGCEAIRQLDAWVMRGRAPDCTLLFDIAPDVARSRLGRGRNGSDRFEQESMAFFLRVRQAYHDRAAADPGRFHVLDGSLPLAAIQAQLDAVLQQLIERFPAPPVPDAV
ncbi:dTMP kinase [Castellaniella sp.]|uniref:dTMP kinase n=1 Tax=Castellaniella sp. TaxID=1955812 RepID=UPI0035651DC5